MTVLEVPIHHKMIYLHISSEFYIYLLMDDQKYFNHYAT